MQARKLSCGNYFASSPGKQKILLGLITSHHGSYLSALLRPLAYEGGLGKGGFLLSFAMETEKENMTITCSLDSLDLFFGFSKPENKWGKREEEEHVWCWVTFC